MEISEIIVDTKLGNNLSHYNRTTKNNNQNQNNDGTLISSTCSSCSSISAQKIFTTEYIYPHWFHKKKYIFYETMLLRLEKMRFLHSRSSIYYDRCYLYMFSPSILITALSSIFSFLSTSEYINDDTQNAFGITVGILASISAMLQSTVSACKFNTKSEAHRLVAEQYNRLIVRIKFEMEMPNEENFTNDLENEILDIQNKCNYFVPQFIIKEWKKEKPKHKKHCNFENRLETENTTIDTNTNTNTDTNLNLLNTNDMSSSV
jgi:hypothetical protein